MGGPAKNGVEGGIERVLHTSVATLYNNLVTRPTGHAVRRAIEQQIEETRGTCLSILDFSHVGVIDFSCADEVIAKLLLKYRRSDRPSEAFFLVQGVAEHHREPIEATLRRRGLLLVAMGDDGAELWGPAPERLRMAWDWLGRSGRAFSGQFASAQGLDTRTAGAWLRRLVAWRVAVPEAGGRFVSLPAVLGMGSTYKGTRQEQPAAAEEGAPYLRGAPGADHIARPEVPL